MEKRSELLHMVPTAPSWQIDWQLIESSGLAPFINQMKTTMQNSIWHGEGDVWIHTCMVCEKLTTLEEYRCLERRRQEELFLAALLHDIGKIPCTHPEEGVWTSPNHTAVGSRMARELLWQEYGLCGTKELLEFRETICTLIRYHAIPLHILDQINPEYRIIRTASDGELIPDFTIELLCLLAKADVCGRISDSTENSLETVELCAAQAEEAGCLRHPFTFPTAFSEYAYLEGRKILPGQELYDDTWGEIILLSGLPGTGKDTWIKEHYGNYPSISLDELRKRLRISLTDTQGAVVNAARELAKSYLREKQPFIWNATSLTPMIREKQVGLFRDYHASVRIVYLETEWEEQLKRNRERKEAVPESVIRDMMKNMTLPERYEAHRVEWYCI